MIVLNALCELWKWNVQRFGLLDVHHFYNLLTLVDVWL